MRFRRKGRRAGRTNKRGLVWLAQVDALEGQHIVAEDTTLQGLEIFNNADISPGVVTMEPEGSTITRIRGTLTWASQMINGLSALWAWEAGIYVTQAPSSGGATPVLDPGDADDLALGDWLWLANGSFQQLTGSIQTDGFEQIIPFTFPQVVIDCKAQRKMRDQSLMLSVATQAEMVGNDVLDWQVQVILRTLIRMPG